MKVKKAIIPAAGMGTRVLPASKAVPKEMLNIVDKPAIQYIVEEAVAAGIEDILIITNRGKSVIEDHLTMPLNWRRTSKTTPPSSISMRSSRRLRTWRTFILSARRRQRAWRMQSCAQNPL